MFRLLGLGFIVTVVFGASVARADAPFASSLNHIYEQNHYLSSGILPVSNTASQIANSNKRVNFICNGKKLDIYKKLQKPDLKKLEKSFGMSVDQIEAMLENPGGSGLPYLPNLDMIKFGFDSPEISELFENFISNPNVSDLAVLLATSEKSSFDKKAQVISADAKFAYGVLHLHYNRVGGNAQLGEKLLKEAAKKNQYGARYVEGMRWYYGYGRSPNLTNAATWMRPSYEIAETKKDIFSDVIVNTFFEIVFHPSYPQRDLYVELMANAQQARSNLVQQINNNNVPTSAMLFRQEAVDLLVRRSELLIELGEILEMGDKVEAYRITVQDMVNKSNMDTILGELMAVSDAFQQETELELAKFNMMENNGLVKLQTLHNKNAEYIADTHSFVGRSVVMTGLVFMFTDAGAEQFANPDFLMVMDTGGAMRSNACKVYRGINLYAENTNFEIKEVEVEVVEGLQSRKKK
jgi:hypothetical protein